MDNQGFRFFSSRHVPSLRILRASMSEFRYDRHAHAEYAFGVTLAGRQDFFSAGQYHRSPPGNVIFFNPEQPHDGASGGECTLNYVMIYVAPERFEALFADAAGCERTTRLASQKTLITDPLLRDTILALAHQVSANVGSGIDQEHLLERVATRLMQRAGRYQPHDMTGRPDALLWRARDYILAHLEDDISLEEISRTAHLSKYHFLRLFRRQLGMTPHQYVINCRINAARSALEAGAGPSETAFRYGFADLSHFNRRFKRIYGMTPYQYQRCLAH